MVKNDENIEKMRDFLSENPEILEQFKDVDAKSLTQPSIILKGGIGELVQNRLSMREVEQYLLMHPVIPRGIDIKANRMTSRGFSIRPKDESQPAKEAAQKMKELILKSGGEILINSWIKDAYAFGNGYLTLLRNDDDEVVHLSKEHPTFFRIAREKKKNTNKVDVIYSNMTSTASSDFTDEWGPMKINTVTKKPMAYTQVIYADSSKKRVEPVGQELDPEKVAHLVFDVWGDEAEGVGLIQYVHLILKYLMNIEEAGAEAIYRSGFTQKAVQTNIKTEKDLKKLAKHLADINSSDSIILPEGTTVENLQPGQNQFTETHDIFLNLIAIRLGIPKPILTLDGTDTNKATMQELMRDLIYDIHADEIKVSRTIEEQIFGPACRSMFGEEFELVPSFVFNEFDEGKEDKARVVDITSQYVKRFTEAAKLMKESGMEEESVKILKFMSHNLPVDDVVDTGEDRIEE